MGSKNVQMNVQDIGEDEQWWAEVRKEFESRLGMVIAGSVSMGHDRLPYRGCLGSHQKQCLF